jgi:hypothetical protein
MGYDEEVRKIIQITGAMGGASSGIFRLYFELSRIKIQLELREAPKGHGVR